MKLSKVKKVCTDSGEIVVKRANCGLDITTWIGTNSAMYPIRGMTMNTALAVRIWEIEAKKLHDMRIQEDTEDDEAMTLIMQVDLRSFEFLIDPLTNEGEEAYPGLRKIATIDGYILLADRDTKEGWVFREDKLGPVEGNGLMYIPLAKGEGKIAVYGSGQLEAVIYAAKWTASDYMKAIISQIAEMHRHEEGGGARR